MHPAKYICPVRSLYYESVQPLKTSATLIEGNLLPHSTLFTHYQSLFFAMRQKQGTGSGQASCRSARIKNAATPKSTSDNSGTISRSPTPVWYRGSGPGHPNTADQQTGLRALQRPEGQSEEDIFMPTTQEVAATLVAMRSRRSDSDNRGHEVDHTKFKDEQQSHILNIKQRELSVQTQPAARAENMEPGTGTKGQILPYSRLPTLTHHARNPSCLPSVFFPTRG